jgi:peptide deformylase
LLLKIVQVGAQVLRESARSLSREEILSEEIGRLIAAMRETMYDAPGVGLAAPQVGLPLQLAVIEDRQEYHRQISPERLAKLDRRPVPFQVLINPKIIFADHETVEFFEGCLSLEGFSAVVARSRSVRVEHLDEQAVPKVIEASGWYARILQHEIDHLHGRLYIDRMQSRTFTNLDNFSRFWKETPLEDARAKLG